MEPGQGMTAEEAVCSPSAGAEKLCFSEPSSVLTAADAAATATDGERGRGKPVPSRPAPSEPGLLPRSPARLPAPASLRLEVTFSPDEASRWVRQQEDPAQPSPGAPRGCSGALLPRQAGVFGFHPAGVLGAWRPPASSPCQCLCWARWCLEELRTLRTLVTPGTGHEHTTDNFPQRRAPRTPVATGDGVRGGRSPGPPQAGGLCGAASPPFWSQPPPARPPALPPSCRSLDEKDVRQS